VPAKTWSKPRRIAFIFNPRLSGMAETVEIAKLRRQQTAIAKFGSFALNESNLQAILNEAARVCAEGLGTKYSKICRFRPEEGDLLIEAGYGWRVGLIGNVVSRADASSPQGRAFTTGDPAICEDLTKDDDFELPRFYPEHGIVSTIDVLIQGAQKAYGVLEVDSDTRVTFDQQDIIYLTGFANVLAEALASTEQRAREAELLANEQTLKAQALESQIIAQAAQKTAEARTTFIATISHELRTPLNAIVGFSALLAKTSLNNEQSAYLNVVQENASHLRSLVDDILDYAKIEAGKIRIDNAPFSLREIVSGVVATTNALAIERPIRIELVIDPDLASVFLGDAKRVRQVLLNIASNAVKFTKKGSIRIRVFEKVKHPDRPTIRFEIQDTGPGVEPEMQHKIFEFYEKLSQVEQSGAGSTGLGLAISRAIVRLMDGDIGVQSDGKTGSTFWFEIPLNIAQPLLVTPQSLHPDQNQQIPVRKLSVLIVEDSNSSRTLLEIILRKLGHSVSSCANGAEAVEAAKLQTFDVIFMDLQMPVMNGVDATRLIRALDNPSASALIVAVTADAFPERHQQVINAGIDQIISKPFDPESLTHLISAYEKAK
jgi:signal transduction histidine kinase/ActR/RegA family two-component response regulator